MARGGATEHTGDSAALFEERQVFIRINVEPLEPTMDFPYLGRTFSYYNSVWVDLYQNLVSHSRGGVCWRR